METELLEGIGTAKKLIGHGKYLECEAIIATLMFNHPHDPIPHNLMGLMYEAMDLHVEAMRHFRAACDLDPEYLPSVWNIHCFGSDFRTASGAYLDADCAPSARNR
jgi:Flp pilus assembly protein TadD